MWIKKDLMTRAEGKWVSMGITELLAFLLITITIHTHNAGANLFSGSTEPKDGCG